MFVSSFAGGGGAVDVGWDIHFPLPAYTHVSSALILHTIGTYEGGEIEANVSKKTYMARSKNIMTPPRRKKPPTKAQKVTIVTQIFKYQKTERFSLRIFVLPPSPFIAAQQQTRCPGNRVRTHPLSRKPPQSLWFAIVVSCHALRCIGISWDIVCMRFFRGGAEVHEERAEFRRTLGIREPHGRHLECRGCAPAGTRLRLDRIGSISLGEGVGDKDVVSGRSRAEPQSMSPEL